MSVMSPGLGAFLQRLEVQAVVTGPCPKEQEAEDAEPENPTPNRPRSIRLGSAEEAQSPDEPQCIRGPGNKLRFHGFRIRALHGDPQFWRGVDLKVGDVVTDVNGQPIGHYEQAYRVWQSLATISELVVSYERAGQPRQLRYVIHDEPGQSERPAASAK